MKILRHLSENSFIYIVSVLCAVVIVAGGVAKQAEMEVLEARDALLEQHIAECKKLGGLPVYGAWGNYLECEFLV